MLKSIFFLPQYEFKYLLCTNNYIAVVSRIKILQSCFIIIWFRWDHLNNLKIGYILRNCLRNVIPKSGILWRFSVYLIEDFEKQNLIMHFISHIDDALVFTIEYK